MPLKYLKDLIGHDLPGMEVPLLKPLSPKAILPIRQNFRCTIIVKCY